MPPTANKGSGGCPTSSYGLICLPPISEDLQLIWTQSELTGELDDNEQLIHTFSYFPYPSLPEIALLCLCYGLQMEKVKTWFMVQRIRCGISWSSEEIEETRGRLLRSQDQLHFKPLVSMARRAAGRGPLPTEHRATTRDTACSPAAFSSFRKTEVGKGEMLHRPPSLTSLSSLANTRPPSLSGLSSLANSRPPSLSGLSSLANARPPSLSGLSSLANSRPPSQTGLASLTNARPPSLTGLSSLTSARPPSLSNAGTPLYTSSVPPLHNSQRPPPYTTSILPMQNNSQPPTYNISGLPLQCSTGPSFYPSTVLPSHNMRTASHTSAGLPLQSSSGLPYYSSTASPHNSRPPSYTNSGLPIQSSSGQRFYTNTTPPSQNNSRPPSYTNAGPPLQSSSGPPFYTTMVQTTQNPLPQSHNNVALPPQSSNSPPLYTNTRPPSQNNTHPPPHTSTCQPLYNVVIKEDVPTVTHSEDVQHHLPKRPRTERDVGLEHHPSPRKEAKRESPQLDLATPVSHRRKEQEDSVERGYRITEQWHDPPARELAGSSLEYPPHHQRSGDWDPSASFRERSQEAHRHSDDKQPSAVAGHMFGVDGTEISEAVACLPSEEELQKRVETSSWNFDGPFPTHLMASQGCLQASQDGSSFPVSRRQRKTKEQLSILKSFFLQCQWARREDYKKLEEITGLPRSEIIQWFGDTRYALKHGQLKWFRDNVSGSPEWLEQAQQQLQVLDSDDASPSHSVTPPSTTVAAQKDFSAVQQLKNEGSTPPSLANGCPEEALVVQSLSSSSPASDAPQPQEDYSVLQRYWNSSRQIKEGDEQRLVQESGLQLQQVQDWFQQKAAEPAEVEVEICLEDDGVLEGDDDDDDDDGGLEAEDEAVGEGEDYEEDEEDAEEEDDDDVIIQD
ncbi:homeobox and leucine zipper protein Homez [Ambystoma mexicanum]|uniref:homeobox and leucine zipper protein Homez n=1 Tax=Ambystoma mexicanum TaxID=8296 RepID=UPI0037E7D1B7